MTDQIILNKHGFVAEILLNRPEKLNAMTPDMIDMLARHCAEINCDDAVRVILLRGAGDRAFCAGSDLESLSTFETSWAFRGRVEHAAVIRAIRKPTVVALKGWVLGGGLEMALSADLRVAGQSARFAAPEVTRGWVGGGGASQLLPRLVGYGQAMRLLLTGERIGAAEAHSLGLVEYLVNDEKVDETAMSICQKIAEYNPIATQSVKAAIRASLSTSLDMGLCYENELTSLCFSSGNYEDGVQAFSDRHTASLSKTR